MFREYHSRQSGYSRYIVKGLFGFSYDRNFLAAPEKFVKYFNIQKNVIITFTGAAAKFVQPRQK